MKKAKNHNYALWDKKRFSFLDRAKKHWLKNLSWEEALRLEENMLSSSFIWHWRKNFLPDSPLCLKDSLKRKA